MKLDCSMCNFADDTALYSCRRLIDILITEVLNTLTHILTWVHKNGMPANRAQFDLRLFRKRQSLSLI